MDIANEVAALRAFSRFFTQKIGVLESSYLDSRLTLPEARIVYETGVVGALTASDLVRDLALDAGYLSRLIKGLEERRLLVRRSSTEDARKSLLSLTEEGQKLFRELVERSNAGMSRLLAPLLPDQRKAVAAALETARVHLSAERQEAELVLRDPKPGEGGWIVSAFSKSMIEEFGLSADFEGLVAEIVGKAYSHLDDKGQKIWIAALNGAPVGTVMIVPADDDTAKLRLLVVSPEGRGHNLGRRLVDETIRFSRQAGYKRISLWTHGHLLAARRVYAAAGFVCVATEEAHEYGVDLVNETWVMEL